MRSIPNDISTLTIELGGAQDGTPNWGTPINLKTDSSSFEITDSLQSANALAFGDMREKVRAVAGRSTITFRRFVPTAGSTAGFVAASASGTLIGQYARITLKPYSAFTSSMVFVGIIETWRYSSSSPTDFQLEELTIVCDADTD